MRYSLRQPRSITRHSCVAAAALLLALALASRARAQGICLRYEDQNGRVLSLSTLGNIVEYPTLSGPQQVFASFLQEGFTIVYDNDQVAWSFGGDAGNLIPMGHGGAPSGRYPNGITVNAFVMLTSQDGLLYVESRVRWVTGTSRVEVDTGAFKNVADQPSVLLRALKRLIFADVRAGETRLVGTDGDQEAFVSTFGGQRFTLRAGYVRPEDQGSINPGTLELARARAFLVDLGRRPFALPDDSYAEEGTMIGSPGVLVDYVNGRRLPGGGNLLDNPDYGTFITTVYTVDG
jgi:hypothetical protein